MAADQRKKRLNGSNIKGFCSREINGAKKRTLESPRAELTMRSHISLEWNDSQKRVGSKREQIGISWRDMGTFIDCVPHQHKILADVLVIPRETFELENLTEVLSYEVWETCLSEKERSLLAQFLPRGSDPAEVVRSLLSVDEFNFGNPFLKWGDSLCAGNLHPDAVIKKEERLMENNKEYHSDLQIYHDGMIRILQEWKYKWSSCQDPEEDFVELIWRPRNHDRKSISSHAYEHRLRDHDHEDNLESTSQSCSLVPDEKACSSGDQNSLNFRGGEPRKSDKIKNPSVASGGHKVVTKSRQGVKLQKHNIQYGDGAKYMSCIKVSKQQYQLIKNMKQAGNSLQSKSLNRVLGNLAGFQVQSYEVFEEEERRKLHEHWLLLVNNDLPKAFANWKERQLHRRDMTKSLEQEIKEKVLLMENEEKENPDMIDSEAAEEEVMSESESDEKSSPISSTHEQPPLQIHELNSMDEDIEDVHIISKSVETHTPSISNYPQVLNPNNGVPLSYYHGYDELSRGQVTHDQPIHVIDLESSMHEEDTVKDNVSSVFTSYPNHAQNELLQSIFKDPGVSFQHQQKQLGLGLDFHSMTNGLMESSGFPTHLPPPLPIMDQSRKRPDNLFIHHNMYANANGSRYPIPKPQNFAPINNNMQDWGMNGVQMLIPQQTRSNVGEMVGPTWFSSDNRDHGGLDGASGSNAADHSLFSMLSHCNELRSGSHYDSMGPTEQFVPARNYVEMNGANGIPRSSNVLSINGLKPNNMGWMSMPNQSSLNDSMGKPFLRSWNQ